MIWEIFCFELSRLSQGKRAPSDVSLQGGRNPRQKSSEGSGWDASALRGLSSCFSPPEVPPCLCSLWFFRSQVSYLRDTAGVVCPAPRRKGLCAIAPSHCVWRSLLVTPALVGWFQPSLAELWRSQRCRCCEMSWGEMERGKTDLRCGRAQPLTGRRSILPGHGGPRSFSPTVGPGAARVSCAPGGAGSRTSQGMNPVLWAFAGEMMQRQGWKRPEVCPHPHGLRPGPVTPEGRDPRTALSQG